MKHRIGSGIQCGRGSGWRDRSGTFHSHLRAWHNSCGSVAALFAAGRSVVCVDRPLWHPRDALRGPTVVSPAAPFARVPRKGAIPRPFRCAAPLRSESRPLARRRPASEGSRSTVAQWATLQCSPFGSAMNGLVGPEATCGECWCIR